MKQILSFLILIVSIIGCLKADAITYEEALNQQKPVAILVYADWADNLSPIKQAFYNAEIKYGSQYNFVYLNIANSETKLFNKTYHIYPNLPYVLLFKDRGRISRYLQSGCVLDNACFTGKLDVFAN